MSKVIISSLYDSDTFKMACRQFDQAADASPLSPWASSASQKPSKAAASSRNIPGGISRPSAQSRRPLAEAAPTESPHWAISLVVKKLRLPSSRSQL